MASAFVSSKYWDVVIKSYDNMCDAILEMHLVFRLTGRIVHHRVQSPDINLLLLQPIPQFLESSASADNWVIIVR
jgi:hypothetical protein